jgi:hypothetical protein
MDSTVIASVITGAAAIIVPFTTYLTKVYEQRFLEPISRSRRDALIGKWQGTVNQPPSNATVTIYLNASRKKITGKADLNINFQGQPYFITLVFTGGFFHDRFLKLDYRNTNRGTIQFGAMLLELPAHPVTMTGQYVGYGSLSEGFVSGNILLTKCQA